MRQLMFAMIFIMGVLTVGAQTTTIKGVVKDNKQNPVPGASISIKDSYDGGTSDTAGKYSFKSTEKGEQTLVITSIGFKPFEQKIKLEGGVITINVQMKEEISELIVITPLSFVH